MQLFGLVLLILGFAVVFLSHMLRIRGDGDTNADDDHIPQSIIAESKMNSVKLLGMFIALIGFALFFAHV